MSNIAVVATNLATSATLTRTTAAAAMPITMLQHPDTRRVWRGLGGAGVLESIFFDLGSAQALDTVDLIYTNLAAGDTTRLRLSVADPTCVTNTYDSTAATGRVSPTYKDLVFLASPVSNPRYGRIDLTRAAGNPEAGFLTVGLRTQFAYNYSYGAQCTVVDPSIKKKTKGGQTKIIFRPKYRTWNIPFEVITEAQRWGIVETIDMVNGASVPVLFILDPASSDLGRDSIFGLLESSPVSSLQGYIDGAPVYGTTRAIEQRL